MCVPPLNYHFHLAPSINNNTRDATAVGLHEPEMESVTLLHYGRSFNYHTGEYMHIHYFASGPRQGQISDLKGDDKEDWLFRGQFVQINAFHTV